MARFLRVGAPGKEKPAVLAADNSVRDLSAYVPDLWKASIWRLPHARRAREIKSYATAETRSGIARGIVRGGHHEFHRHWPELLRSCPRGRDGGAQGTHPFQQSALLHRRPR